ncbi:ZIP zinc/iron transport family [Sanghuangporus baumii]|uniref:ZIP zinc/iron transport family n=1 Tax=Sanghuangporus baumii TaxID=108892 RepID=A0A9Q5HT89_SANBA|nr:ZIP zinc/iron transport family [Sanghuangporus baumii]
MSSIVSSDVPSSTDALAEDAGAEEEEEVNCGSGGGSDVHFGLRIASIFIILVGSTAAALFPIIARRTRLKHVIPKSVFDFAKYFGSGVIIATAFIHLLAPAIEALGSSCLTGNWQIYPWALALCMLSVFVMFLAELIAFRWGTAKLRKLGVTYVLNERLVVVDAHGHDVGGGHAAHGPEAAAPARGAADYTPPSRSSDDEKRRTQGGQIPALDEDVVILKADPLKESAISQIIGICVLEFGVVLHSVLIGLTLAVDEDFKVLFVVLVFHQIFEGLGLGSRLAYLTLPSGYNHVAYIGAVLYGVTTPVGIAAGLGSTLPSGYNHVAYIGAVLYGVTTPVGIAAGLGVRSTYNPESGKASAVSGIMDALSAGVLLYTGLVELLAHEFLFSSDMQGENNKRLAYACVCMILGAGLMALLGRWA